MALIFSLWFLFNVSEKRYVYSFAYSIVKLRFLWLVFTMTRLWKLPIGMPPAIFMMGISAHYPQRDYDRYQLRGLWCLHFYRYEGELKINGDSFPIAPGSCSVTPPGALLEYAYHHAPSIHAVAHFELASPEDQVLELPAMRELHNEFEALAASFEEAVAWQSTQPARAEARVWDILWQLGALNEEASTPLVATAALERAKHFIEMRLGSTNLRVEAVAAHAGFSHNHFTRLFQSATGSTPARYIRKRRVERAIHLLKNSTLPIKAIAAQCGLGDLQAFNKTLRKEMGISPRAIRCGKHEN